MLNHFALNPPVVTGCQSPYSFFLQLVAPLFVSSTSRIDPLHRMCSLMRKMGAQCFVTEGLEVDGEIEEERAAASQRTGDHVTAFATRYTFFRATAPAEEWSEFANDKVLGYAVVVSLALPDRSNLVYVLEAAAQVPTMWLEGPDHHAVPATVSNQYIHCCRQITTTIGKRAAAREFTFIGTYFYQQNGLTHVCAHAALRAAINNYPLFTKPKLTNAALNVMFGIDLRTPSVGRYSQDPSPETDGTGSPTDGTQGVDLEKLVKVIEVLGFRCVHSEYVSRPAIHFAEEAHPIIESGCPAILVTWNQKARHVVAVLGHTMNSDRWAPEARIPYGACPYVSAAAWTDHLVIADDNYGMYENMPTDQFRLDPSYKGGPDPVMPAHQFLAVLESLSILPQSVTTYAYLAEQTASQVAENLIGSQCQSAHGPWLGVLGSYPTTIRTLLQSKAAYIAAMAAAADQHGSRLSGDELTMLDEQLPDRFWVSELTVPHLYAANKRKLGEILIRAEGVPEDSDYFDSVVMAWLPGWHWLASDLANNLQPKPWSITGHIPLLRGNGSRPTLEW